MVKRLISIFLILFSWNTFAQVIPDKNVPEAARKLLEKGVKLAIEEEKISEGLIEIKKSIAIAPQNINAHKEYVRIKTYWLDKGENVKSEYESLMKKEPENPVFPLALALGQFFSTMETKKEHFRKVARLAPEWSWGHYAKARLLTEEMKTDLALDEFLKAIEKNPSEAQFYAETIPLLIKQKKFVEAADLLEKMKSYPKMKSLRLGFGWDLRLAKAENQEEEKKRLIGELEKLTETSDDFETLSAVRIKFRIWKDKERLERVEEKLSQIDPKWYPERSEISFSIHFDDGAERVFYAGKQKQIHDKLKEIKFDTEPSEQIEQLENLLKLKPDANNKKAIYERLLSVAVDAKNNQKAIEYGEILLKINPNDVSVLAKLARIYAEEKQNLKKASAYSLRAMELTKEFVPMSSPDFMDKKSFEMFMPESRQREFFNARRSSAVNARSFVLMQTDKLSEAETLLRESLKLNPTENAYSMLEKVLRKLGREREAEKVALEGENLWRDKILSGFKKEAAKDFELTTITGEKVKLSDLKGKIVLINFWATWCVPCVEEMPLLVELYDKYKDQGLEILAISVDSEEERSLVKPFVKKYMLNFPVFFNEGVAQLYGVSSYPTTLFIDREGNVRYRDTGFSKETGKRKIEFVIGEIIKTEKVEK